MLYDHFICLGEVFYQFGGCFEPPTSPDICTKKTFSYLVDTNYLMFSHIIPIGPHKVQETRKKNDSTEIPRIQKLLKLQKFIFKPKTKKLHSGFDSYHQKTNSWGSQAQNIFS